jgi:hypothetical protein
LPALALIQPFDNKEANPQKGKKAATRRSRESTALDKRAI